MDKKVEKLEKQVSQLLLTVSSLTDELEVLKRNYTLLVAEVEQKFVNFLPEKKK